MLAAHADVNEFDGGCERHAEIGVALWNLDMHRFGDKVDTDHDEEGKSENFDGGMLFNEVSDWIGKCEHDADRDNDGGNHDFDVFHHSDSGDDAIERKHYVEDHDLDDHAGEGNRCCIGFCFGMTLKFVMNFLDGFPDEEKTAEEEDEVFAGGFEWADYKFVAAELNWFGEGHDPAEGEKEQDSGDESGGEAELSGFFTLFLGKFSAEDRNENDVINSENDF